MMLHFAYGSNMSRALMRPRCPGAKEIGTAVLEGYRFVITTDGYASVTPAPGCIVHGLLWRLTPRDLAVLNAYESVDSGLYRAMTLPVRAGDKRARALIYRARSCAIGMPRPGYMEIVVSAARELKLPAQYVRALERWAPSGLKSR